MVEDDLQNGVANVVPVPTDEGHIWRTGFEKNELKGVVFYDVSWLSSKMAFFWYKRPIAAVMAFSHVPKVNGEFPSLDKASLDHQRLQLYQLVESKVRGDANCFEHCRSDQVYRTTEHNRFVKQQIVNQDW
ncbi:hypothetical protein L1887_31469 [Cichorium endivia]|nr:hypothetical protein L1887_31469 [Cichorium endivia]